MDYSVFLFRTLKLWRAKDEILTATYTDLPFISIIIAARNEELTIQQCLISISENNFQSSSYEIIVVDDHSTDKTNQRVHELEIPNLKYYSLEGLNMKGKKSALKVGFERSIGEVLLFTDADTILPPNWITSMASHLVNNDLEIVTGPIKIAHPQSLLSVFQALDIGGTMIWTGSGIWEGKTFMANGANLCVTRRSYSTHREFLKQNISSGDDIFLIQSVAKSSPDQVDFLKSKNAMVGVFAEKSLKAFLNQRLRWSSKTSEYSNTSLKKRIGLIYIFNLLLIAGLILGATSDINYLVTSVFAFLVKSIFEAFYLLETKRFFNVRFHFVSLPLHSGLQTIYMVVIGSLSILGMRGFWKGRRV